MWTSDSDSTANFLAITASKGLETEIQGQQCKVYVLHHTLLKHTQHSKTQYAQTLVLANFIVMNLFDLLTLHNTQNIVVRDFQGK